MKKLQLLGLLALLTLPLIYQLTPLEILKLKVFDVWVKEQPTSNLFVTLDITEEDVQREGGWPFPRDQLAEIHLELLERGAMGVGYVIAFSEPDRFGGDEVFAHSLSLHPSVLAMFETDNQQYPQTTGTVILGDDVGGVMLQGATQNIDILKQKAYQGISSAPIDVDGLTRRLPLLMRTPDGWTPAFGIQILKVLAQADTYVIKTNDNGLEEIRVRGLPPVSVDSLGRKWISWVDTPSTTLQEMNVEDKFVIVGVTANGVMPQLSTPAGLLEPHKIQAALAESILIQDSPYIPDYALSVELLILSISIILIWSVLNVLGITLGVSTALVIMTATGIYGYWTVQQGILIDVTWSLIAEFITASTAFYLRFREQYKLRQQIKKQFEHYLDPRQVKQLQNNPGLLKLGGEKRYATFLFTDVRGFTSMSETLEPEEVTYIMNKALTAQQSAVQKHGGMVDKYIGDAMMAIFNAPLNQEFHENKAIDCALDIQKNMEDLNIEMAEKNLPPVAIGIGINTGYAVIGNMGSEQRFDYTAIGDAVNTGARLESGTKEAGVDLLIGYNTAIKSDYELKLLEPLQVKGKEKPLQVYTI
jgi:adenylate cyclase